MPDWGWRWLCVRASVPVETCGPQSPPVPSTVPLGVQPSQPLFPPTDHDLSLRRPLCIPRFLETGTHFSHWIRVTTTVTRTSFLLNLHRRLRCPGRVADFSVLSRFFPRAVASLRLFAAFDKVTLVNFERARQCFKPRVSHSFVPPSPRSFSNHRRSFSPSPRLLL